MARLYPFRAWHCNPAAVHGNEVITHSYDAISPAVQQVYCQGSLYRLVRMILGLPALFDAQKGESVYAHAPGDFCPAPLRAITLLAVLLLPFLSTLASAQAAPASRFVVVVDAAHGGQDSGAKLVAPDGTSEPEKTYTLALSVRLRSLLAARGISVVTTRESDTTLDAGQRDQIANHANAQACVSLHAALTGSGVHLFISSLPPVPRATFIPWKTAQAAFVPRSIALAGMLNSALTHAGIKVTIGRTALPVLDSMTCPAVAVEVAPPQAAAHPADIGDDAYQAQIADAVAAGLLEWRASSLGNGRTSAEGQNP